MVPSENFHKVLNARSELQALHTTGDTIDENGNKEQGGRGGISQAVEYYDGVAISFYETGIHVQQMGMGWAMKNDSMYWRQAHNLKNMGKELPSAQYFFNNALQYIKHACNLVRQGQQGLPVGSLLQGGSRGVEAMFDRAYGLEERARNLLEEDSTVKVTEPEFEQAVAYLRKFTDAEIKKLEYWQN
jgi:hypothetical protein